MVTILRKEIRNVVETASRKLVSVILSRMRNLRLEGGLTLKALARKLDVSPPQIQRIESGDRRLTLAYLEKFCEAMDVNISDLLIEDDIFVPVIGLIDSDSNIQLVPANIPHMVRPPRIVKNPGDLAAVRWASSKRLKVMDGHLAFFYGNIEGVPEGAWGKRCVMRRTDGTYRYGWLFHESGQVHAIEPGQETELNIDVDWASPVLGVISPQILDYREKP
jgi:transcriptional regulator with XRE-family HTH domain